MTALTKGLLIGAIHVAIVSSLGAKLLVDRHARPRIWVRTAPVDPNLPIRGRYVQLRIEAAPSGLERSPIQATTQVILSVRDGRLIAEADVIETASSVWGQVATGGQGEQMVVLTQPVAYFIPEHVADPSRRAPGEELWVEVTVPRAGLPRPIRLGVKKDGVLTPIDVS
jgi:uncharacterized membrane-anchored protein